MKMIRLGRSAIGLVTLVLVAASCSGPSEDAAPSRAQGASGGVGGAGALGGSAGQLGAGVGGVAAAGLAGALQAGGGAGGALSAGAGGSAGAFAGAGGIAGDGSAGVAGGSAPAGGAAGLGGSGFGGAGLGGVSGVAGGTVAGLGGMAAGAGQGGAGMGGAAAGMGGGTTVSCTFTVNHARATIATVEAVTWSTTLAGLTSASIEFGPAGGAMTMVAPVDLAEPMYRTLLLGMKQAEDYTFRIVARAGNSTCTSEPFDVTTGTLSGAPTINRTVMNESGQDRGFIVTSAGLSNGPAYVIDADGDVVWAATAPSQPSRARMSYDGKHMYMMSLNVTNLSMNGSVRRIAMDGTGSETLSGLNGAHHDFTVTPDNGIAIIVWSGQCTAIMKRSAAGQLSTLVANVNTLYQTQSDCHTNAINYNAWDDSFTLSDRNPNVFVKISSSGALVWQLGGSAPKGASFTGLESWQVNHGHQWLPDKTFVFFNNGAMNGSSRAIAYTLNETAMTATRTLNYAASGVNSPVLSDVQRLPNGNYLVTFSQVGQIHEITSAGALVQRLSTTGFGYAEFRKSMYGAPLR